MTAAGRRWIVLLAALAATLLTARLGVWQLDRAAQKNEVQATLDARMALPALLPAELAREVQAAAAQHHRAVRLEGQWLAERTVYLENRQMNGRPGFFAVTPLRLEDGSAVLVQRGPGRAPGEGKSSTAGAGPRGHTGSHRPRARAVVRVRSRGLGPDPAKSRSRRLCA